MDTSQVSAARLISQGLIGPAPTSPTGSALSPAAAVVEHLGCVQAQAFGGALVSVALRADSRPGEDAPDGPGTGVDAVRAALDSGELVRTWTQRGTIHLTTAKDVGWILGLTGQRLIKSTAKRREFFGITDAMLDTAADLAAEAIRDCGPLTRQELLDAFAPLDAGDEYGHDRYLITTLALQGIIVQAPTITGKDDLKYVLTDEWVPAPTCLDAEAALHEWTRRFVLSHGPVTVDDTARWMGLPKTGIKKALAAAVESGEIVEARVGEIDVFHAPDLEERLAEWERDAQATLLLPGFDEIILGYKDRSATLARTHEKAVVPGGNGMFKNTVIQATIARGTWKRSPRKTGPRVVIEPFDGENPDIEAAEAVAATHPAFG